MQEKRLAVEEGGIDAVRMMKKDVPAEYRALIQRFRLIDDTFFKAFRCLLWVTLEKRVSFR